MTVQQLQHVHAGELITSDWANGIIDEINSLAAQVAALGTSTTPVPTAGPPILTGRSPMGDVSVGDRLTLFGENLGPRHDGLTRVNFGPAVRLTETAFLAGSSDTQLSFAVPNAGPGTVPVTVTTPEGTSPGALIVNVHPVGAPGGGSVHVDSANDPAHPPTPQPGQPLQLQWTVDSDTVLPDTYAFNVSFVDVQPQSADWTATLNAAQMLVSPGTPFTVVATVVVPNTGSATVILTVTSTTDSKRHTTSAPVTLNVGSATPTSDARIALRVVDPQPQFDALGNPSNAFLTHDGDVSIVNVTANSSASVLIQVHFNDPDSVPPLNYRFFSSVDDAAHWAAMDVHPPTLVQTQPGGTTTVRYDITNRATDAALNDAELTVSAAKLQPDGSDEYVSFTPVTIRNAGPD